MRLLSDIAWIILLTITPLPCGDCAVVWWTGSVWRVRWDATQLDREPTHWMPLPALPDRRPPEGEEEP